MGTADTAVPEVSFDADPGRYRHIRLEASGEIARIVLRVDEGGGLVPGYDLKLNSYDLGVDIELHDAVQRLRFEHPEVRAVVITGGLDKVFCAGANIRMLAQSAHPWKVNFCKFTNETRAAIEDATEHSGQVYLAAINGTAAGGGYEMALACDQIILVDDGSTAVSLPEVPLLAVLPGTGGLTRVVDKRGVRKDLADVFATRSEGVRGQTAKAWRLVDEAAPPSRFEQAVRERAEAAATRSHRPRDAAGIALTPLEREVTGDRIRYPHVAAELDRPAGIAEITLHGPRDEAPDSVAAIHALSEPGNCFAGPLLELALATDRQYMLDGAAEDGPAAGLDPAAIVVTQANFGAFPMANGLSRLASRFYGDPGQLAKLAVETGRRIEAAEALELGLVTFAPDDIDWADEVRIALEERASLSPDALTGMEANHRFVGPETIETKIFARLTAWQNWVFTRPNASGPEGALRRYGTGQRPTFDRQRV